MERSEQFFLTLFSELNEHIRATDAKSLTIAGFYVALCGAGMAASFQQFGAATGQPENRIFAAICVFVLLVGSFVNILQYWYRLWKAHYIQTCKKIARSIFATSENSEYLPAWLRAERSTEHISIDGLMHFLTGLLNFAFLLGICWIVFLENLTLPLNWLRHVPYALPLVPYAPPALIFVLYYSIDAWLKSEARRLRRAD